MPIFPVSVASDEAKGLIRELDDENAALYPRAPVDGIDISEFESAGGYFVVAKDGDQTAGCGGFRRVNEKFVELKRLFVRGRFRRRGFARQILRHLEDEIRRRGYLTIILETGCDNVAAIALFKAEGYLPIRAFRGDAGVPHSRCYAKQV